MRMCRQKSYLAERVGQVFIMFHADVMLARTGPPDCIFCASHNRFTATRRSFPLNVLIDTAANQFCH